MMHNQEVIAALIALFVLFLVSVGQIIKSFAGLISAQIDAKTASVKALALAEANAGRLDRQGNSITSLQNGGGSAKIDSRLREHGLLPPIGATQTLVIPNVPNTHEGNSDAPQGA